jgi:hypothetical protein
MVFDGAAQWVQEDALAIGERYAMLGEVGRVLVRVELWAHRRSICISCIYVKRPEYAEGKITPGSTAGCRRFDGHFIPPGPLHPDVRCHG